MVETNAEMRRKKRQKALEQREKIRKYLKIALAGACVITALIVIAAVMSGDVYKDESEFQTFAASYFEGDDAMKTKAVGESREVIKYGQPLSVAMEYPVTGQDTTDSYIANIVADLESQFLLENKDANKDGEIAMFLDYDSYDTQRTAVGIVFSQEQQVEKEKEMTTVKSDVYTYNFSTETGRPLTSIQIFNPGYKTFCSQYLLAYFSKNHKADLVKGYEAALADTEVNLNKYVLTERGVRFYFEPGTVLQEEKGTVFAEISYEDLKGTIRDQILIRAIDPNKPMVALTFDDGPYGKTSNRILDCLEKYNVLATFFELGQNVEAYPEVIKREAELGMEIGSHSWSHPNFKTLSAKSAKKQINKTNNALKKACGQASTVFRPPYGNDTKAIEKYANAPIILWSVDTLDWKSRDAKKVMKVVKQQKHLDGSVVLMHSIYKSTAKAVEKMVPWLLDEGYQLVTVSELLHYKYDETPKNGKLYGYDYFYAGGN